ncbi:esterase 6-like [Calliphora vicina]|uniref:esterase 6-like n=1 Tax=Calliphora vicina TaxID=7373 RepID=UPI00325AA624
MQFKCVLKYSLVVLIVVLLSDVRSEEDNDLIVKISNGKLRGLDNGYYYSYESIPYAKAPVADLSFEPPQPYNETWHSVFDATKKSVVCMQWDQFKEGENKLHGSEDCLFVNVYKPKTDKEKYPVVAYIHGGAFMFGSANVYGEDLLMKSGNVILVKISYRLGPLGFLSTEDDAISGNYGLKDQQLALKWIKNNIKYFGGDPEKILLIGFSAGGSSAHLQMLQPSLENIAKAVVSFSGVAFNPWVIIKNPLKNALKLAQHLQCPDLENTQAIKQCLKQKTPEDIVTSVKEFLNFGYNPFATFGPVVEHKNSPQAFMTEHPRDIIKSGNYSHLPWLASYAAQDGGYNAAELLQINPKTGKTFLDDLNGKWLELAPQNLFLQNINSDPIKYAQQLKDDYLSNLTFSEENYLKVQEIYTDVLFKNGVQEALKLHSEHNKAPVYAYVYDNPSDFSLAHDLAQRKDMKFGTVHSDDFTLMLSFPSRSLRPDEEILSQKFIKMLENFISHGEPTFGDCKFVNNAGNSNKLDLLLITKDKCENIVQ